MTPIRTHTYYALEADQDLIDRIRALYDRTEFDKSRESFVHSNTGRHTDQREGVFIGRGQGQILLIPRPAGEQAIEAPEETVDDIGINHGADLDAETDEIEQIRKTLAPQAGEPD